MHVVKALGEYLTSDEGDLRNKGAHSLSIKAPRQHYSTGLEFLALVVGKCPLENFNLQSGTYYTA